MMTVLVAEDEIYARQSLVKQIREYDSQGQFRILEAENGAAALELALQEEPELVLTDIRMPLMDGIGLLKELKERNPAIQVVMLSAYSEFEYARSALANGALDYLLKPIEDEELKKCLDKFLHQDRNQKRETVITGQDAVTRFIMQKMEDSSYHDFMGSNLFRRIFRKYQVLALSFRKSVSMDAVQIFEDVEQMFQEEMWTGFRMLRQGKQLWILVIHVEQDCFFFQRKLVRFFEKKGCEVRIGVSLEHADPEEIGQAVQESRDALTFKIFLPDKILTYSQISQKETGTFRLDQNEEILLRQALKNRSRKKTEEILHQIFEKINQKPLLRRESLELFFNQMMVIMQEALHGDGFQFRESGASVLDFDSMEELEDYITQICMNISSMFEKEKNEESSDMIEQIVAYVSGHYEQDITLKDLAENLLYMNPTYVSHCFVERMGISFSAWLRGIRIGQAKKLLEGGGLSITEIASASGYNDTSQFIRAFKQETQMTPKKYRDWMREQGTEQKERNGREEKKP